ncbi:hypothetical protein ACO0QE_000753 [Hanseniaspora vineae]
MSLKNDVPESIVSSVMEELNSEDQSSDLQLNQKPTLLYQKKSHDKPARDRNDDKGRNTVSQPEQKTIEPTESLYQSITRAVTVKSSNKDLIVPRNKRNGLFSRFSLLQQYKDAREYPKPIKNLLVFIVAAVSIAGPMGTSIIFPCIESLEQDLNTTTDKVNIAVGIYLLGLGIFPIWWSSISEFKGRRSVYIISFSCLVGFSIGCALCKSIGAFIVLRLLCGASSSSAQTMGAGVLSDLFIPEERGAQIGLFYLGSLMAPLLSPIIGSLLVNRWSWRSTQWFMVIFAACNLLGLVLLLPETLRTINKKDVIKTLVTETKQDTTQKSANAQSNKTTEIENVGYADEKGHNQDEHDDEKDEEALINRVWTNNASVVSAYERQEEELEHLHSTSGANHDNTSNDEAEDGDDDEIYAFDPVMPQMSKVRTNRSRKTLETHRSVKNEEHAKQRDILKQDVQENLDMQKKTGKLKNVDYKRLFYTYGVRPLKSLYYLQYPPVALSITFSAISFAVLYFVNITVEYTYSRPPYNFKPLYIGLLYIPNSVTYIIASIYGGRWVDRLLINYKKKHGILAPEARISYNVLVAVVCFPISLLIFGWCLDKKTFWVCPLVGTALFGFASMMTIGATVSYLVDSVGSVGVAVNNLIRMILAAIACFTTDPMLKGMGVGWAFTMLAFIVLGSSSVLLILKWKSNYWRETIDLDALHRKVKE